VVGIFKPYNYISTCLLHNFEPMNCMAAAGTIIVKL
jgi:hypothetical protein